VISNIVRSTFRSEFNFFCVCVHPLSSVSLAVFFAEAFSSFFAATFWSLKHFVRLSHSYIKTRRSSVHWPIFSDILTEMIKFFRSFQKRFGLWPTENLGVSSSCSNSSLDAHDDYAR